MADLYQPPASIQNRAYIKDMDSYREKYERSISDPEGFWEDEASDFHWFKKWERVCSYNYDMNEGPISIKWFEGGKTNIVYNCLDRHLDTRGDQKSIVW